ncbi:MAG TPA: MBL fold metallo-hydrolase [Longimicrobiales bacterium]|nr:MBL fold metallo-hydrolase [Longimicrobiales bacterium]
MLRSVLAPNASAYTLDGTRTYLVGRRRVAVIDPGPADPAHVEAVAAEVGPDAVATILVTHWHPDHAAGAMPLAERMGGAPVLSFSDGGLEPGRSVETDAGRLIPIHTPGHSPDHLSFHWPESSALFCGDLMLGGQGTVLVAWPEGDLSDYLRSLEQVRALGVRVIYPAHGPPITEVGPTLDRYVRHREERLAQALEALGDAARSVDDIVSAVYGADLNPELRRAATGAIRAYLEHLARTGDVLRLEDGRWRARRENPA